MGQYNLIKEDIREEALDLEIGDTKRILCPFCQATHEKSLSISRLPEGLFYRCFRVSCKEGGFIPSPTFSSKSYISFKKKFVPKEFKWDTIKLPPQLEDMLYEKYTITKDEIRINGIKYAPEIDSLVMPIFNKMGYECGVATKVVNRDTSRPKVVNYFFNDYSRLHYPQQGSRGRKQEEAIVIVEDILSSIRVNRYATAVSLLGTHMTPMQAKELAGINKNIIIALDPDATDKAIGMKRSYGLAFNSFKVVHLSCDPKDYYHDKKLIEEIFE